ncbi:MAG: 4Fe-4S binding protein [Candidatus Omnitrophica bacterium]|nr:4Fe-4S binding protein [Candidatus Omnitrophota bacterium]MCM8802395.1 4Fe-4S binding protein [Candidatus Omnitrophota bacterium]
MEKKLNWKELSVGDILEGGSSLKFKTGNWRIKRPVHIPEKCINCFICWISCPDDAIIVDPEKGKWSNFNYDYCKGCGICAYECPKKAIEMKEEVEK